MPKHFNTTGPVHPKDHSAIDPMSRLDWEEIHHLIETQKFFVLHAPRQTGKTTTLLAMADVLNQSGDYTTLYINVESAQSARGDVPEGMKRIVDSLVDGYIGRPGIPFVQSAILCGVRDVRDYRIHTEHHETITGGSACNIKAKSLRMGSFNQTEIATLYAQHTTETGQIFDPDTFPELWEDTHGQPWLVNALGNELTWEDKTAPSYQTLINLYLRDCAANNVN